MSTSNFSCYADKLRQSAEHRLSNGAGRSIQIGQRAPDFTLFNTEQQPVTLHETLKNSTVVLIFFPLAFSSVCTEELCSIRDQMKQFNRLKATVLAISTDSMFALKKFKEEKGYQFDLLSDFNKTVAKQYNVLYDEFPLFQMKGVSKRAAFVIDTAGIIQHMDILANPGQIPDLKAIEQVLEKCEKTQ